MAYSVYKINKGINKSIEFHGLKAQYIWWLGGAMIAMLVLFALLYISGVNAFVCIGVVGISGAILCMKIMSMSKTYGEHGLKKKIASRSIPEVIKCYSRKVFIR
jgi:hypothetical protein